MPIKLISCKALSEYFAFFIEIIIIILLVIWNICCLSLEVKCQTTSFWKDRQEIQ